MPEDGAPSLVDNIFGLANKFATPFAQKLADDQLGQQDGGQDYANQLLRERLYVNALNGSGAPNALLASQAPQGILDFITGQTGAPNAMRSNASYFMPLLIGVVLVAGLVYFLRKM